MRVRPRADGRAHLRVGHDDRWSTMVETVKITHCCGHDKAHTIRGGDQARAAAADWLSTTLCRECWLSPDVDRQAHPASFARTSVD